MTRTVYLAGPVSHGTLADAAGWRDRAAELLATYGIESLSPVRCEGPLDGHGPISSHGRDYPAAAKLSQPNAVLRRDHFDVRRSDLVLANFLGATRPSLGTAMEMGFAYDRHIPVVMVMETGNVHDHMMLTASALAVYEDLDEALAAVASILA